MIVDENNLWFAYCAGGTCDLCGAALTIPFCEYHGRLKTGGHHIGLCWSCATQHARGIRKDLNRLVAMPPPSGQPHLKIVVWPSSDSDQRH